MTCKEIIMSSSLSHSRRRHQHILLNLLQKWQGGSPVSTESAGDQTYPISTPGEAQHFCLTGCCPKPMLHSLWSCALVNAKVKQFEQLTGGTRTSQPSWKVVNKDGGPGYSPLSGGWRGIRGFMSPLFRLQQQQQQEKSLLHRITMFRCPCM